MASAQGRKRCTGCGKTKALQAFHKHKGRKDGRNSQCKNCRVIQTRDYYAAHFEQCVAYAKEYRATHTEAIREAKRSYRAKHLEERRAAERCNAAKHRKENNAYCRAWYKANSEKCRANARRYRKADPKKCQETVCKCRAAKPEKYKKLARAATRVRRARKHSIGECFTGAMEAFMRNFWLHECALCGSEVSLCADHWLPLSKGHALAMDNAVLLCHSCNSRKGATLPSAFLDHATVVRIERKLQKQAAAWELSQSVTAEVGL